MTKAARAPLTIPVATRFTDPAATETSPLSGSATPDTAIGPAVLTVRPVTGTPRTMASFRLTTSLLTVVVHDPSPQVCATVARPLFAEIATVIPPAVALATTPGVIV